MDTINNGNNEHPCVDFLKFLYQHCDEGFINLRFIPKDSAKPITQKFIPLSEIESIPKILKDYIDQYHCYFAVATRINGNGSKDGIIQIPTLWIDLDLYKLSDKEKEESRQRCKDFPLKPTFIINSGGGRYFLWMLKEPASREDIPKVENLLKRLASYFYGDMSATDATRILRILGSLNHKYQHTPQVIIKDSHPERQCSLDDFDFLPQGEPLKAEEGSKLPEGWEKELLGGVEEGERNNAITRLVGRYVGKGLSREEILPILLDANSRFKPPLDAKEIESCLDSVIKTHQRNHPNDETHNSPEMEKRLGVSLRLTTLSDVFEYPEPNFVIDQILIEGTVSVLGAYTGVGKSITALSIIKSLLTGNPLWGKYQVLKTGPVLLVDEETPKSFLRERIEKMGFDKTLPFYFLHFQDVRLDRDDCFNALMTRIEEIKPVLVVIDSLIRVHRQKEDDATSMSKVVDRLRKIANWGTTVLVIHHHRKGEGPLSQKLRGSSDIPGGVDIEYALTPKDDYLVFSSVKTRTKPLAPIRLKMEADDEKIEVTYQGVEIGERGEILSEVVKILKGGEVGVKEIYKDLHDRGYEIGDRTLRDILRNAVGKELVERSGERGKKFYGINPGWQFISPIYICETAKVEGDEKLRLAKDEGKLVNACQGQTLDNQGSDVSFAVCKDTPCQGDKLNILEGEI